MKEKISQLLDDELNDLEHYRLMKALEEDRELRGVWERYHIVRAAMRMELDFVVSPALADRVGVGIRRVDAESAPVQGRPLRLPRYAKMVAGGGIAASVVMAAIFTLQPLAPSTAPASLATLPSSPALVAGTAPVNLTQPSRQGTLNSYLVEHSEFTPNAGMNGMMSYVRIVGYGNSKPQNADNASK